MSGDKKSVQAPVIIKTVVPPGHIQAGRSLPQSQIKVPMPPVKPTKK